MGNLLDSSVWVALFLDFDTQHAKAKRIFPKLQGKIYLPYCVIIEVVTVLVYKHSKEQANQFILFIEQNQDIKLLDDELAEEIRFYKSLQARISFVDAALLFLSKKLKTKLVTFDQQLQRLSQQH